MRDRDYDYDLARRVVREWKQVAAYMLDGDYYPLTPYSAGNDVWMAWQFDVPEKGEGIVQAFRRADCIYRSADLPLNGLDPDTDYAVTDLDTGKTGGREAAADPFARFGSPIPISHSFQTS